MTQSLLNVVSYLLRFKSSGTSSQTLEMNCIYHQIFNDNQSILMAQVSQYTFIYKIKN